MRYGGFKIVNNIYLQLFVFLQDTQIEDQNRAKNVFAYSSYDIKIKADFCF